MADTIQLEVITPDRGVVKEAVEAVTVPGLNGELGILPGHTPLISQLRTGILFYTQQGATRRLLVSGGFVEVNADRVSVLADVAERAEDVDTVRAQQARDQSQKELASADADSTEHERAQLELERALVRLQLAAAEPSSTSIG